ISLTVYHREEYGFAVAEGMTCGAPTLITNWGGGADAVEAGGAMGIHVSVGENGPQVDILGAAEQLANIIEPSTNRKSRKRALAYDAKKLSEAAVAKQWRQVLSQYRRPQRTAKPNEISLKMFETNFELFGKKPTFRSIFPSPTDDFYQWVAKTYASQNGAL